MDKETKDAIRLSIPQTKETTFSGKFKKGDIAKICFNKEDKTDGQSSIWGTITTILKLYNPINYEEMELIMFTIQGCEYEVRVDEDMLIPTERMVIKEINFLKLIEDLNKLLEE
jgi:hypothetical protein